MAFCKDLEDEERAATTVTAIPQPQQGAVYKGMVKPPTTEELAWEIAGLSCDLDELMGKHRRTRIVLVLLVLYLIWRSYAGA